MKKIVALALALVLVLSLCATAFADYYPTVSWKAASKNQVLKYGKGKTLKFKCDCGTGPFYRVLSTSGYWIWRANYDIRLLDSSYYVTLADVNFTGRGTDSYKLDTKDSKVQLIIKKPTSSKKVTYKLLLNAFYKKTVGSTVYRYWYNSDSAKTKLYIKR